MQTMVLIGAESVENAGRSIARAAEQMSHAASQIESALQQHAAEMGRCIERMEALERAKED